MRKRWEEPQILVQEFIANEYVAACGDSGTTYYFVCDADSGYGSSHVDRNGKIVYDRYHPLYRSDNNTKVGGWNSGCAACGETHTVASSSTFVPGYFDNNENGQYDDGIDTQVYIWFERNDYWHCTTNIDMSSWETEKS